MTNISNRNFIEFYVANQRGRGGFWKAENAMKLASKAVGG